MKRGVWAPCAALVAALLAARGEAASVPDKQALEGVDSITVNASVGPGGPPECGSTAALVRSAVAGRLGQAGLKIAEGAPIAANAQAVTLAFERGQVCVTSVTLRIGLFAFYFTDPATRQERLGEVMLVNKSGMLTSDTATHSQQVAALVRRMLDEFVLDWREANLMAQIDKLAPAAGGDTAALSAEIRTANAQRRLAQLGLYGGAIDGVFGQGTARAVSSFQKANGLEVTGQLDEPTYVALVK